MDTQQGCKFCRRYGLPVLPVRPAVMTQDDILPPLPAAMVMPVATTGDIAYTARLLRQGFLNIWSESEEIWINYYVTRDGYYYPLPEEGNAPPDLVAGTRKPCINKPEELATASLVTLPVKPVGMKNGLFWFGWSQVEWTRTVRKKYEDAAYRSQHMQPFDMDAWLTDGKTDQALVITALADTVAEYSRKAISSKVKKWSAASWKTVQPLEGVNLQLAAHKLWPDKGAMVLLQDPPGILEELSAVIDYDLQENIYQKEEYKREVALASAITGLKEAMMRQFERDHIEKSESEERNALYGAGMGYMANTDVPDNMYTPLGDRKMKTVVAEKWAEYEQYYDPEKMSAFQHKFNQVLTQYNDSIVTPRTGMYLAWMKSNPLLGYFKYNFDSEDLRSGIEYVRTLNCCIAGMQDKVGVSRYLTDLLSGSSSDATNILARALVFNQKALAEKLEEATQGFANWYAIPWSGIANAFKECLEKMRDHAAGVAGVLVGLLSGCIASKIIQALESNTVYSSLVAMGAITNKAFVPLEKTGKYKHFVAEVVSQLAKESGLEGKVNRDRLRHYVRKELRRLRIDGLPMEADQIKKYLVMVNVDEVPALVALPPKEQAIALSKLLRTTADVEAEQFSRWQGAVRRGVRRAGEAMPFTLGVLSGVFQVAALYTTADFGNKKTLTGDQKEAHARFLTGIVAFSSTLLSTTEAAIKHFRLFTTPGSKLQFLASEKGLKVFDYGARVLGVVAGGIAALIDLYHAYDEFQKGHRGLAVAYLLSGAAGAWVAAAAAIVSIPVIGTFIAIAVLIIMAIYLAFNSRDSIQKWLLQCLWRRIPVDSSFSQEEQEKYRRREAADLAVYPDTTTEMNELKLALGGEG